MAELLLNPEDRRTKTEKMKEADVSRKAFYSWMKDKRFVTYLNSQLDQYTDGELSSVWRSLINQCVRGNVSAMKLFFELKELHPEIKLKREIIEHKISSGNTIETAIMESQDSIKTLAELINNPKPNRSKEDFEEEP